MAERLSDKHGKKALKIARQAVDLWVRKREKFVAVDYPPIFNERMGAFTTLYTYPKKELRGCIGYPEPFMPLIRSLINSAIHATEDPRFPNLTDYELDKVLVEVSILTRPERVRAEKPEDILKKIEVGKHGLIVRKWSMSGLLLPQVAEEHKWKAKCFLEHTCMKALLPTDAWLDPACSVYRFESRVFHEKRPPKQKG